MQKLLQIDFPFTGPFGDEMTQALNELALSITEEPGFIWKIWTESKSGQEAGGIYLFADKQSAQAYLDKHTARLKQLGVTEVRARIYDVNSDLSKITKAPI
ncbi:monooxygenase [Rheinheimera sp. WS51]|uniref:monooxygenase n=1 Tax=Rheinheimera sp. WS51 TaxID=3425886 RepID=UPI003D8FA7E2